MIDTERYNTLKKAADKAKEEASKAEGALQHQMKLLQDEFGCATLEEAEALLKTMDTELAAAESAYHSELAAFETQWGEKLRALGLL